MKMKWLCAACFAGLLIITFAGIAEDRPAPHRHKARKRGRAMFRQDVKIKVGDTAPDFTLKTLDGKGTVTLSDSKGKRPVVLIFGSYT